MRDCSSAASTWSQNHKQVNTYASHASHEKLYYKNLNRECSISPLGYYSAPHYFQHENP
jgi:hypothetical protein